MVIFTFEEACGGGGVCLEAGPKVKQKRKRIAGEEELVQTDARKACKRAKRLALAREIESWTPPGDCSLPVRTRLPAKLASFR
jgi:hypothetical protein